MRAHNASSRASILCTRVLVFVSAREWSIRIRFHSGSTSQFPRFGSMSPMRLWNILALVSCADHLGWWMVGTLGTPPDSLKLVAGATHMMATPTWSSIFRSTLGGTMPSSRILSSS